MSERNMSVKEEPVTWEDKRPWRRPCPTASQQPTVAGRVWPPCSGHWFCLWGDLPQHLSVQWGHYMFLSGGEMASKLHDVSVAQPANKPTAFFFSCYSKTGIISLYDCVFKKKSGYNQKLHRDDREHAKSLGLHVNEEVTLKILIAIDRLTVCVHVFNLCLCLSFVLLSFILL